MTNVNIPPPTITYDQTGHRNDFIPQSPPPVPPGRYLHFDDQGNLRSMENFDGNGRHSRETIGRDGSRYFVTDTERGTEFELFGPSDLVTGKRSHDGFSIDRPDLQRSAVPPPNPQAGSPTTFTYYENGKMKDIFVPQPPPSVPPGKYVQFDDRDDLAGIDIFDGNGTHVFQESFAPDGSTYAAITDDKGTWFHLSWPKVDPRSPDAKGIDVDLNSGRGTLDFTLPRPGTNASSKT